MRILRFLGVLALSAVGSFALAMPDGPAERKLTQATAHLEKGRQVLAAVPTRDTNAARLGRLDRALYFFRRSRTLLAGGEGSDFEAVRADASRTLVGALDDQADIYYERKSLPLARKRAREALSVDPRDSRALSMLDTIERAESKDIYSDGVGTVAIQRIRERRAAAGIPLRDRGLGSRR